MEQTEQTKEYVNHPDHYKALGIEVLDMMELIWGKDELRIFCRMNSFKYRMRAGLKNPEKIQEDIKKALFYEDYANKL